MCDEIKWFSCKTRQEFNEHTKKRKKVRDKLLVEKIKKKAKFFDNYEKTSSLDISQLFNLLCANIAHLIALMMNARKFFMSHINIQCKIIHKHFSFQQLLLTGEREAKISLRKHDNNEALFWGKSKLIKLFMVCARKNRKLLLLPFFRPTSHSRLRIICCVN
mgnify:CR=1 FL=1